MLSLSNVLDSVVDASAVLKLRDKETSVFGAAHKIFVCDVLVEAVPGERLLDDRFVLGHVLLGKDDDAAYSMAFLAERFRVDNRTPFCVFVAALKAQFARYDLNELQVLDQLVKAAEVLATVDFPWGRGGEADDLAIGFLVQREALVEVNRQTIPFVADHPGGGVNEFLCL